VAAPCTCGAQPAREAQQDPTQDGEDPARIDRLRPEFDEHASVEAIDAQTRRARRQQTLWERRVQKLTALRQTRVAQKERGEGPAAAARPGQPETDSETQQ
jgi:hypothetical protein